MAHPTISNRRGPMRPPSPSVRPALFFVVTFVLSWLIWIPLVLSRFEVGPFRVPQNTSEAVRLLGVLMPAIAAIVLTALASGLKGIRVLLRPLKTWRVGLRWWAAAVLVQPVLLILSGLAFNFISPDEAIQPVALVSVGSFLVSIIFLLIATLGEEIGWRGLALPALEQRHNALNSSTVLGLLWAAWHVPFWLLMDTYDQYGLGYLALSFVFVLAGTVYITWFYNHGRFSLLLPVVFHVSYNIVNVALLPVTTNLGAFAIMIAANCILAVVLVNRLEPAASVATRAPAVPS
jgi:membrane protease YdiL (CAAX protease family)